MGGAATGYNVRAHPRPDACSLSGRTPVWAPPDSPIPLSHGGSRCRRHSTRTPSPGSRLGVHHGSLRVQ
eukprot:623821-Pyramimonas_sp.AAC.1